MILLDEAKMYSVQGRSITSAHMVSNIPGSAGTEELLAMATLLGLKHAWLQKPGDAQEHFDVSGAAKRRLALALGARLVTSRELVEVIWQKRRAMKPL